jgi:hypothetical protein
MTKIVELFLKPSGWLNSRQTQRPMTSNGRPLPWFTYGAIEFLSRTVTENDIVFEYGAGNSTLWWQSRALNVCSVEHDTNWCSELTPLLTHNTNLKNIPIDAHMPDDDNRQRMLDAIADFRNDWPYSDDRVVVRGLNDVRFLRYAHELTCYERRFDIIVIDGMARRLCAAIAADHVKHDGMIIFDNSNRSDYSEGYNILSDRGFKQIPFWGLVPGGDFLTCTSIFLKDLTRLPPASFCPNTMNLPEY